ncbi:MAG TPA: hypothetical protein VGO93_09515 [Candidatus Xenobia bacterium]
MASKGPTSDSFHTPTSMLPFNLVLEGELCVDVEGRRYRGAQATPRLYHSLGRHAQAPAPQRTVVVMVENQGIVPTGD